MAFYSPSISFYPCPIRAADIFKPQPPPPPIYYLTDHVRVEYNDGDWDEEEASTEEVNGSNHTTGSGQSITVVGARRPLGLLSVMMREHREKENVGINESKDDETPKEGRLTSPGMPFLSFPHCSHPRSRAICAGCEGGYRARTTVYYEKQSSYCRVQREAPRSQTTRRCEREYEREEELEGCLQTEQASRPGRPHPRNGGEGESSARLL